MNIYSKKSIDCRMIFFAKRLTVVIDRAERFNSNWLKVKVGCQSGIFVFFLTAASLLIIIFIITVRIRSVVCRCGSGWTSSRILTLCSTFTSRAPSTRVCRSSHKLWWPAVQSVNRNSVKTRHPANFSTPETSPSTGNGSRGTNDWPLYCWIVSYCFFR